MKRAMSRSRSLVIISSINLRGWDNWCIHWITSAFGSAWLPGNAVMLCAQCMSTEREKMSEQIFVSQMCDGKKKRENI